MPSVSTRKYFDGLEKQLRHRVERRMRRVAMDLVAMVGFLHPFVQVIEAFLWSANSCLVKT